MAAHINASEIGELSISENMKVGDSRTSPRRDEKMAVAAKDDTIRVVIGRQALHDLARRAVYDCQAIADVLRHVNELAARCNREAGRVARARAIGRFLFGEYKFFS